MMIEGEDGASSGPKRNRRTFWGRLSHPRGWPPGLLWCGFGELKGLILGPFGQRDWDWLGLG